MILSTLQFATGSLTKSMIVFNKNCTILPYLKHTNFRDIHITSNIMKQFRMGNQKIRVEEKRDIIMDGEDTVTISDSDSKKLFPDASTPYQIFDGKAYNELDIVNVKSTPNNTIMSLTDYKGKGIMLHSAGIEGFKNTRKGTNIAAQQTAITFGRRMLDNGFRTVRLRIQGIGPGRMGAIKGFQLAGVNVVSITDDTRVSYNPPRPRKQRRI
ncbi:30S ribosomal protein S11 isoform X1 [Frieseomelitta varia]|uniref:30S ribosomal protein S11 isoform X1 n=1 Tax=Frieseomelitta varia TaxID=561572 RepID=UPI001CB6A8E1|nr:30S ribosomal protein S11 isoform X1 [Frieseomelitta varia]